MRSPMLVLPFSVPGAETYPYSGAETDSLIDLGYDPLATRHWIFGSAASLADNTAGALLARNLSATVTGGTGYPVSSETSLIFAGGTGSGAAGYAVINGSGVPTQIVITNHGAYTVAPMATISGGGTGGAVTVSLGAAPDFSNGYLRINTGRNGLASPIADSAENTVIAIVKKHGTALALVFDNGTDLTLASGAALFKNNATDYRANTAGVSNADVPAPGSAGAWLFVAMTHKPSEGRRVQWGGGSSYGAAGTKTLRPTPPKLGIGQANFGQGGFGGQTDFLEYIIVDRALSSDEIGGVYVRAKARQAALGRTVV